MNVGITQDNDVVVALGDEGQEVGKFGNETSVIFRGSIDEHTEDWIVAVD